jgi:tetratricopeptide (TPR) repeat protein
MEINPMYLSSFEDNQEAKEVFLDAYRHHLSGQVKKSVFLYKKSIRLKPTAEAYTFLGWAFSMTGKTMSAIRYCKKAISVDPTLGNPYNDIGVYLIELEQFREAIPWLEKAKLAQRYECVFFAYFNLGRAYEITGHIEKARLEYEEALNVNPDYHSAIEALKRIKVSYN